MGEVEKTVRNGEERERQRDLAVKSDHMSRVVSCSIRDKVSKEMDVEWADGKKGKGKYKIGREERKEILEKLFGT